MFLSRPLKFKILLLHPSYIEGISLFEVRQFHILEVISNISKIEQIKARAIRFQSHNRLPEDQRHVDIYMHITDANTNIKIDDDGFLKNIIGVISNKNNPGFLTKIELENFSSTANISVSGINNINYINSNISELTDSIQTQINDLLSRLEQASNTDFPRREP